MAERLVEVELPNKAVALVRVPEVEGGGAEKVAWPERFTFTEVAATLEGLAQAIRDALDRVSPTRSPSRWESSSWSSRASSPA